MQGTNQKAKNRNSDWSRYTPLLIGFLIWYFRGKLIQLALNGATSYSPNLVSQIQFEGFESEAYQDEGGTWTCGYRHAQT